MRTPHLKSLPGVIGLFLSVAGGLHGQSPTNGQFIYAAQNNGLVSVYDINQAHRLVKTLHVFSGGDVRGACATVPTHRFYVMYNAHDQGHVLCLDLTTDRVIWDKVEHTPYVDRGDVTPDGKTLYLPSGEDDANNIDELVVDASTGNIISQIPIAPLTHDTCCSLDGTKVFLSDKSNDNGFRTISTATNQITRTIRFASITQPFVINGKNSLVLMDVLGVYGFQYADLNTGQVLGSAFYTGTTSHDLRPHGIGMTPDEREAWGVDRGIGNHFVHVFDLTSLPPRQTHLVTISHDDPHWITFDMAGRFCYVSGKNDLDPVYTDRVDRIKHWIKYDLLGYFFSPLEKKDANEPTDIVSTATYERVGVLAPEGSLLEVDFASGNVTQVGSQYGLGRIRGPASAQPRFQTVPSK